MPIVTVMMVIGACLAGAGCCGMKSVDELGQRSGAVRHVVLFKYKESATAEQVKRINEAFAGLAKEIPQIAGFEWGTNVSPEGLDQGLTHAFLVTFRSTADRDAYLVHPAHKAFVDLLKPSLEKATVLDYLPRGH